MCLSTGGVSLICNLDQFSKIWSHKFLLFRFFEHDIGNFNGTTSDMN